MTDEAILAELLAASPTFAADWRLTETHYPTSDPETLPSALHAVASHLHQLVAKDRHRELGPLLAAVERGYAAAAPAQRELVRRCVIEKLARDCGDLGLDPELFRAHLGPESRAAWDEAARGDSGPPVA